MSEREATSSVAIRHHFDAAPGVVWAAWTEPRLVRRWWGSDPGGQVTSLALDVCPGGEFTISFEDPGGEQHTSFGEYLVVEPLAELVFTWSWASEPGNTSRVSVLFRPTGSGTEMRFVHGDLRGESQHDYEPGWRRTFSKLDRVIAEWRG
ncbi:SRPBCC family protein [Leifsonia sp. SIMBA_070]|uniref:SRPBCC family protein n=1 Tax=Leifsonia sp. SIMBA_070 TaxID=3085810 RepID=UPI00397E5B27